MMAKCLLVAALAAAAHAVSMTSSQELAAMQKEFSTVATGVFGKPKHQKAEKVAKPSKKAGGFLGALTPVASIEDMLTGLMLSAKTSGGTLATPMEEQVEKIKFLIDDEMLPAIEAAHNTDQATMTTHATTLAACTTTKDGAVTSATASDTLYKEKSPLHKECRTLEGELLTTKEQCHTDLATKTEFKTEKCDTLVTVSDTLANEATNKATVTIQQGESQESYIRRVHDAFCGADAGDPSDLDEFEAAKTACDEATTEVTDKTTECATADTTYADKVTNCNNLQKEMDDASCSYAVQMKDACEAYSTCYGDEHAVYLSNKATIETNEVDRKAEWKATMRMKCLIDAFSDGKMEDSEVTTCKEKDHDTDLLNIDWPSIADADECTQSDLYPATAAYKLAEFANLPAAAAGDAEANICTGIYTISTTPTTGSPDGCTCTRVTLNGVFSPGALVKCTGCTDVKQTTQANSCPSGTKLFAPTSRADWETFITATEGDTHGNPFFIVDITRPQNSCGGCKDAAMHSGEASQTSWVTSDGQPWWLRADAYSEPNGDYDANCYLAITSATNADGITFNDGSCNYNSDTYYCQTEAINLAPREGSPDGCSCTHVVLTGAYSAGYLLKCTGCTEVSMSTQANSCPEGTKLFSPASRADWTVVFNSGGRLASPNWIVDVTRPQTGCGGCADYAMHSGISEQATWTTSDGSAWWLRSAAYSEPNGDYTANCYLDLTAANEDNADNVIFNDGSCGYKSNAYYCQPAQTRCSAYTCPDGWEKKSDVDNLAGTDHNCCQATCSSHTCGSGYKMKSGVESTLNPSDEVCCELEQTYEYVGCYEGNTMARPYGDKASTLAGVQECRDACANGGYEYWGAECPHANGVEFHCECGNGSTAMGGTSHEIQKCSEFNAASGGHCSGPFEVTGDIGTYVLGAGSIGSVYKTAASR